MLIVLFLGRLLWIMMVVWFEFSYMLHELLMALMGQPGAIIKRYNQTFAVDPSVTLLSQPEANMISEIAQTGYYYQ